ncbi:hypothetical protein GCM10010420_11020 [Streptomyces glaucosporus]|uniref:Integral membrane protein n=1 Tax=Streptomyces glaucosporus TaxID=284044 RepID=A0ABN3HXN3_9ACTN
MPDDVGGRPSQNGEEPDDRDRTEADDAFASVVFDEEFVRAALIHEPSAAERIPAAQSPSETEAALARDDLYGHGRWQDPEGADHHGDPDEDDDLYGRYRYGRVEHADRLEYIEYVEDAEYPEDAGYLGYNEDTDTPGDPRAPVLRPYRGHVRWQRPVAWVLAVLMGVGIVALAFAAVYRGAVGHRQQPPGPPPATTGVDVTVVGRSSGALPPPSGRPAASSARLAAPGTPSAEAR